MENKIPLFERFTRKPLPFPRITIETDPKGKPSSEEYVIPPEHKAEVLALLYPFVGCPKLTARKLDIHENKKFVIRDFKVVRERGANLLVSPYYYNSGGTVIDWC
ncbi:MAG: hypothetical protein JWM32_2044 [Verrucomicrobia bacterium]|nr:hypothetical protein [Verrucomicrobiota bacterium]